MHQNLLKNTTNIDFGSLRWYCLRQVQLYLKVVLIQKSFFIPNNDNKDILLLKKESIQNTIYCHVVEEIGLPFSLACSVKFTPSLFLCRSSGNKADKDT